LAKLPEDQQEDLRRVLREEPELERVKDVTSTARWLSKAAEAGLAVRAFQQGELNFEKALQEAQRLDALGLLADAVGQAQALEAAVLKLHTSWRRLGGLQERLWVESGSSTPHLRELLTALQSLSGSTLRVSLGELAGGKRVRLQLVEESPEQLEALALRPHPSDPAGKYDALIAVAGRSWPIRLDQSPSLSAALAWADSTFGCETQALVASLACGLPAFSTVPPWAPPCRFPQASLQHLSRLD
jgi:hypothetical protein